MSRAAYFSAASFAFFMARRTPVIRSSLRAMRWLEYAP